MHLRENPWRRGGDATIISDRKKDGGLVVAIWADETMGVTGTV
jgi:hypothetical protein